MVVLDLRSDPELVAEGQMRDLNRGIQDLRKKAGLAYADRIELSVLGPPAVADIVEQHRDWLASQVLAVRIDERPLADPLASEQIEVGDEQVTIALRKA